MLYYIIWWYDMIYIYVYTYIHSHTHTTHPHTKHRKNTASVHQNCSCHGAGLIAFLQTSTDSEGCGFQQPTIVQVGTIHGTPMGHDVGKTWVKQCHFDVGHVGHVGNWRSLKHGTGMFLLGEQFQTWNNVGKTIYRPSPGKITIFTGGMFTIPKWFVYYDYINDDYFLVNMIVTQ